MLQNLKHRFLFILGQFVLITRTIDAVAECATKLIINNNVAYSTSPQHPQTGPIAAEAKNFVDLVSASHVSVDKSQLIEFFLNTSSKLKVLTCPHKWGKTTNMLMLRDYLRLPIRADGTLIPLEQYQNYQFFKNAVLPDGKKLPEKLLVSSNRTLEETYLGKFPVIYINFGNITGTNLATFKQSLARCISEAFREYEYLLKIIEAAKKTDLMQYLSTFQYFLSLPSNDATVDEKFCKTGLNRLCGILSERYLSQVYVLIDDYDAPVIHALVHPEYEESSRYDAVKYYDQILTNVLKNNALLNGAILTGTFRVSSADSLTIMDQVVDHSYLDDGINQYCGITGNDFDSISEYLAIPPETKTTLRTWFNGFPTGFNCTTMLVNPYSLARYLQTGQTRDYLEEQSNIIELALRAFLDRYEFLEPFLQLMSGRKFYAYGSDLGFKDHPRVADTYFKVPSTRPKLKSEFVFFLDAGYLALGRDYVDISRHYERKFPLRIPNTEIRTRMWKIFKNTLEALEPGLTNRLENLMRHFEAFALNDESTSSQLENATREFLNDLPYFVESKFSPFYRPFWENKDLIHEIPNWIMAISESSNIQAAECQFKLNDKIVHPHHVLVHKEGAIICEFGFANETTVLDQVLSPADVNAQPEIYIEFGSKFKALSRVKIIKVHVHQNKTTEVRGGVVELQDGKIA